MPGSNQLLPLAATAVALLLAASAVPVAGDMYGGGRMVIVRASGARAVVVAASAGVGARNNRWYERRRLEDEVAPEFGGLLLGAEQGHISEHSLHPDRPVCGENCPGKGEPYTRPCSAFNHCRG